MGFYEMLQKSLSDSPNKNSFQSGIWKVFMILLEYCCKTNYQMLVSKLQEQHQSEIQEHEKEMEELAAKKADNEKEMQEKIVQLSV